MKCILLIISNFILFLSACTAQVCGLSYSLSTTFPNVNESKTRVLENIMNRSLVFIDTLDTTYICLHRDYWVGSGTSLDIFYKKRLPQGMVISDMEDVHHYPWYCGSLDGDGVYGSIIVGTNYYNQERVHAFRVPIVNNLSKFTMATNMVDPYQRRMFAIGETYCSGQTKSYIMEFDVQGTGISGIDPFLYAQMSDYEHVDDVELVEDNVVFSTRDDHGEYTKASIRISRVEQMLAGSQIDRRWELQLQHNEDVLGKVFVTHLNDTDIGVCFVTYINNNYILHICRINIDNLYHGITTFDSKKIIIPIGEEIMDIKYDSRARMLIVLLDKDNTHSVFVHINPYLTAPSVLTCIESKYMDRYFSIDTIAPLYFSTDCVYEAWGGEKGFVQGYSSNGLIQNSCYILFDRVFEISYINLIPEDDPIRRETQFRSYEYENNPWEQTYGERQCFQFLNND